MNLPLKDQPNSFAMTDHKTAAPPPEQPAPVSNDLMVVGIGASAGGVAALREFFSRVKADDGCAYVIVQHLSPEHASGLVSVLQSHASIPVLEATEAVEIQPNRAYVIPPGKYLTVEAGRLQLVEPERVRGAHTSIDLFFRTLADSYGKDAAAIILSGSGSDGTLGLRRIKEHGGITMAQTPDEAEYDSMPRNALDSGLVDLVLPAADMPQRLRLLRAGAWHLPPETAQEKQQPTTPLAAEALRDVLTMLRLRTGHDFAQYKSPTLLRRIGRRIQVHELADIGAYRQFIREHPEELQPLLRDLLITVTNFFRDRDAFEALERDIIPKLFAGKRPTDQVRVWVPGCATGEEAYSIAILLAEHAATLADPPKLQVFASDIDEKAIGEGRACRYPQSIALDVSPERLKRFFVREGEYYRVSKEVRELVLFAPHNLLRDPPFSRLDLISCRNLMIYLNREVQERVLAIFNFALRPGGYLFLGASDSAEGTPLLFSPVDKKHRAYLRRSPAGSRPGAPPLPVDGAALVPHPPESATAKVEHAPGLGELHHRVVEQLAPPSLLIDENYDIVHLSEHAGRYLLFNGGEPSRNLLRIAHPDLRLELRACLFALRGHAPPHAGERRSVRVRIDDEPRLVHLSVRPVRDQPPGAHGYFLVTFDETVEGPPASGKLSTPPADGANLVPVVTQLEDELEQTKGQLRLTIEQYETTTEELKASNEELQAINEELRSASEELETSKEELQSLNEELTTINQEYREKIQEVGRANSDLQNLMASTDIGTLFLDRELQIKRYTPQVQELFNVTPADIGRPLQHFTHNLDYARLNDDAEQVLRTLHLVEREVRSRDGRFFLTRLLPYRTLDDRIDGVVLTFVDISERRRAEERLREQEATLREQARLLDFARIIIRDPEDRIVDWNTGAERFYGYSPEEALGQISRRLLATEFPQPLEEIHAQLNAEGEWNGELIRRTRNGERVFVASRWVLIRDADGAPHRIVEVNSDITERKRDEAALEESERRIREILDELPLFAWTATPDGRFDYLSPQWLRYTGASEASQRGDGWLLPVHADDRDRVEAAWRRSIAAGTPLDIEHRIDGADGQCRWFHTRSAPLRDPDGAIVKWFGTTTDIDDSKQDKEALLLADRRKDEFLAMLSHELRNPLAPIQWSVEILKQTARLETQPRHALDVIERQVSQLSHLVNELLDLARIQRGTIALEQQPLDFRTLIDHAIDTARPLFEGHRHTVTTRLPESPVRVFGDPVRLAQVVGNLLTNAAKFTPANGLINVAVTTEAGQAFLRVSDNGTGIAPELLPAVFDVFTQEPRTLERSNGGLGIGLSLAKRIVEMHGGRIEAHSAGTNLGSEFLVALPLLPDDGPTPVPETPPAPPGIRPRRILIVDDNCDAATTLAALLSSEGHETQEAHDGPAAIEAAKAFRPEVILLDIGLPGMSGLDVARVLRSDPETQATKLIAVTGYGDDEMKARARDAGFSELLVKPVTPDALRIALAG